MLIAANPQIVSNVQRMRESAWAREAAMRDVRLVREGKFDEVWPDQFSSKYPHSMVANFVDVSARDLAASLSPLPTLACASGHMRSNADKERAEKKNRIGFNYWLHSRLEWQMKYGADQYVSYGFLPFWVEADYENSIPFIHVEDPEGAYFEIDRQFKTKHYARVWKEDLAELAIMFPEYSRIIMSDPETGNPAVDNEMEVVRYIDDTNCVLYLPQRGNLVVGSYPHKLKRCPVHIALRPGLHLDPRGLFDDVLYVQMAHSVLAQLTLEAGHKMVQAPLAIPSDVNEVNFGPDAIIVTDQPQNIRHISIDLPQAAFALDATLKEEMREGVGYPDSRLGNGPAGGSTGRGVEALQLPFDSQISLAQDVLKLALIETTSICFELDATLWPDEQKEINGVLGGESFQVSYLPSKDIGTNYNCNVTYGFSSGTSQQGKTVTLLQLRGDNLIGRDTARRQLDLDIDVEKEQRDIDVEVFEDGLRQGMAAALQSSGQMMAQGMVAEAVQYYQAAAQIIKGREQGVPLADLFIKYFQPPPPPQAVGPDGQPAVPGGPGGAPGAPGAAGGDPLDGVGPTGLPPGVAPGQAGLPPGGRPRVTDLAAGFSSSGAPAVGATVRGRLAAG